MEHVIDGCTCEGKQCKKCLEVKCLGHYKPYGKKNPTLKAYCQPCDNARKYAWAEANPEKVKATLKNVRSGPEYQRYQREYRSSRNYDYWYDRERRVRCPEWEEQKEAWRKNNPDLRVIYDVVRRTRKTQAGGSYTLAEWEDLKAKYNYTCLCCGKREPEIKLTPDHIKPVSKGGTSNIYNIQPLCRSCNSKKHAKIVDFRP